MRDRNAARFRSDAGGYFRLYLTYEGSKPENIGIIIEAGISSLYLTYEGSKRRTVSVFSHDYFRLYLTYEGSKPSKQAEKLNAVWVCILPMRDRNYVSLKTIFTAIRFVSYL